MAARGSSRWRGRITILFLAAIVVLPLPACTEGSPGETGGDHVQRAEAPWKPADSDLLFTSNREGNLEIYILPAGKTEWVNLTRHPAGDNWGVWSPDGERIAFQSRRDGNLDVWVMNADGSEPRRLTDDPAHDYVPSWSPDGRSITFASWRLEPGESDAEIHIYIMNADGTDQRRLLPGSPGTSTPAIHSPGGHGMLMTLKKGEAGGDIFFVDPDGAATVRLTNDEAHNGSPALSPDGRRIAFYSDSGEVSRIVVMGVDGADRREITATGRHWYPRWSPDGLWLAATAAVSAGSDEDLDVVAIPLEGGPTVTLAGGPGRESEGSWRPIR